MPPVARPIVIVGPTGVGKTHVAIELAHRLGGELVGADSVQIYRGFDIGSAKPTSTELGGIAHHLIDVAEPDDPFDAARYAALADAAIAAVVARGRVPIVVGGTGLWIRALLRGLVVVPKVDAALRTALEGRWDEVGSLAMHQELARVDSQSAARIHVNDKLRVIRALEVHAQTGTALGALRAAHALGTPRYDDLTIVLDLPLAHHAERVRARTQHMFDLGFAAEVAMLVQKHGKHARALQSVGYRQMLEELERDTARELTVARIVKATTVYARRQRTWWKTDPNVQLRLSAQRALEASTLERLTAHAARRV